MIYELTSTLELHQIIEMARTVITAPVEILRKRVIAAITHPDSKIFIDRGKANEIRGFIFGTIEELDGDECVFIHLCVVKPEGHHLQEKRMERQLTLELVAKIESWARERGIKIMYFMTRRNPDAFKRKFKFELDYYLMKREVK